MSRIVSCAVIVAGIALAVGVHQQRTRAGAVEPAMAVMATGDGGNWPGSAALQPIEPDCAVACPATDFRALAPWEAAPRQVLSGSTLAPGDDPSWPGREVIAGQKPVLQPPHELSALGTPRR